MTSSQYYNIICGTLGNMAEKKKDSIYAVKKVFDNFGEAFPSGNCAAVLHVLKSNDYVSWRNCTAEEAQKYANEGIPTVAINEEHITIVCPEESTILVKNTFSNAMAGGRLANTVNRLEVDGNSGMEFFAAYASQKKDSVVYAKVGGVLTVEEQECNADYFFDYLSGKGLTKEAICGILGNIEQECNFNPADWYALNNISLAYGLFQWNPVKDKYLKWAAETKILKGTQGEWAEEINTLGRRNPQRLIDTQLEYFFYSCEANSGLYRQWYVPADKKNHTGYKWASFSTYQKSTLPVRTLALIFHDHYENSEDTDVVLKKRQDYAEKWYNYFR